MPTTIADAGKGASTRGADLARHADRTRVGGTPAAGALPRIGDPWAQITTDQRIIAVLEALKRLAETEEIEGHLTDRGYAIGGAELRRALRRMEASGRIELVPNAAAIVVWRLVA